MPYLYYPYLMGISALIAILFIPEIKKRKTQDKNNIMEYKKSSM